MITYKNKLKIEDFSEPCPVQHALAFSYSQKNLGFKDFLKV